MQPERKHRLAPQRDQSGRRQSVATRGRALAVNPGAAFEVCVVVAADALVLLLLTTVAHVLFAVLIVGVAAITWKLKGLYSRRLALSVLDDLPSLTTGVMVALVPATLLAPQLQGVNGRSAAVMAVGVLVAVTAGRRIAYAVIVHQRASGRITYPTLMVGAGAPAAALTQRIQAHPESGLRLVGAVADHVTRSPGPLPLLGTSQDLARLVSQRRITDLVIGYGGMSSANLVDVLRTCDRINVEIYVVPRLFELHSLRVGDDHIWGFPLVRVRRPAQRVLTWRVKRAFDVTLAAVALLLCAPVIAAVALAARLELGHGVIFRQTRIGLQGRPFELMKFRSMQTSPEVQGVWSVSEERIGRVGRFIRRYSLDELPQLVNVLKGDMSLVGPRPERPEYVEQFCLAVPRYLHRHRVPVGMTGLAAVNGLRGDTSIEDRADFDNWYIDNWSLWLDVKILIRTLDSVLKGTGG